MRVVCVGDVMVDVLARLPGPLAVGSDTPAPVALLGGGSAANTAAWCVAAGVRATLVGRVGDDALGRAAVDELAASGVDLELSVDPELPTGTCIVLVDPSGERTMIPSAGANAVGGTVSALPAGAVLHLSGYALFHPVSRDSALAALHLARAAGHRVCVDAASVAPLRGYGPQRFLADVGPVTLFANRDEAGLLSDHGDPAAAARELGARCGAAFVKCGRDGAVWSDGSQLHRVPAGAGPVRDSTGAGDAFAAGVLAAELGGAAAPDALRAGSALAARAIARPGGRP